MASDWQQVTEMSFHHTADKTKLTMPVLAIACEKASARTLSLQMKLVANDATVVEFKDTGHWLMEERPKLFSLSRSNAKTIQVS